MTSYETLTLTVAILSFIAAAGAAIYAGKAIERATAANKISEASLRFQVLVPALTEYMSAEMYIAIGQLWSFYKIDPATLQERYKRQRITDAQAGSELLGADYVEFTKGTIDYSRRKIGQFYGMLTSIYDEGGSQRKWIYTYWRKRELQIIPNIIIPLEEALSESIAEPVSKLANERLLKLFNDCPG
jgi:hypothetical protein